MSTHLGSSPLARGLLGGSFLRVDRIGIIPARAGFTYSVAASLSTMGDHPRSRGVYLDVCVSIVHSDGSSPLARGLHGAVPYVRLAERIIPARAGFTA